MIRLAVGVPGSGKSLALQDIVARDNTDAGVLFIVTDHAGEWLEEDRGGSPNPRWRGEPPRIFNMGEFRQGSEEAIDFACEQRESDEPSVLVCPNNWEAREVANLAAQVGDCVFVDDEIDFNAVYKDWADNPVRMMVHRGRHLPDREGVPREVHVFGAARRYQSMHTDLTSMADEVMVFRVQGEHTIARLIKEGVLTDEQSLEVQAFPDLQFINWTSRGDRTLMRVAPIGRK